MLPSAAIFGISGPALLAEERKFFERIAPLGFILFARNCVDPVQVKALVAELKALAGHKHPLILIDQEGGRVARLKPPHWRAAPSAGLLASLPLDKAKEAIYVNGRLIAAELHALGINVDCAPVVDLRIDGAHDIVGDRAYGTTPDNVTLLAREMARGLMDGGVLPVIKHIPGHGRALVDSHKDLPVVDTALDELRKMDFAPFKNLADLPFAMTAHVLYTAIDSKHMATLSPDVINLIRREIGFKGILMSDDLSMEAMQGNYTERTRASLNAGCDLALHCNGKMEEMEAIAKALVPVSESVWMKVEKSFAALPANPVIDEVQAEKQLAVLMEDARGYAA